MKTLYKQLKALHRRHILLLFATCSVSCSTPLLQENRKTADKATEAGLIAEARDILTAHYVDPFFYDPSRDTTLYVLVDRLDPYSGYFSPQRKKRFDDKIESIGDYRFGFSTEEIDDTLRISTVLPESMLHDVGITIGDRLLAIDNTTMIGRSRAFRDSIYSHLPDWGVVMQVLRPSTGKEHSYVINKSALAPEDHFCSLMLNDSVLYIAFDGFWEGVASRVDATLTYFREAYPKLSHTVIDLRINRGGLLNETLSMVNLFCKDTGVILTVHRATGFDEPPEVYHGMMYPKFGDLGLTVLVGGGTYSASEVFAGCVQDLGRGLIIGQQTGGKGLVMHEYGLSNGGALYIAIGRYYLPSGRCIQTPYVDGVQYDRQKEPEHIVFNLLHRLDHAAVCDDSAFHTTDMREVYGGMGVIPDVYVPDRFCDYAECGLRGSDMTKLWYKTIDRYQGELCISSTYEDFLGRVPIKKMAAYLTPEVEAVTGEHVSQQNAMLLADLFGYWIQMSTYGVLSETPKTLADDQTVAEALTIMQNEHRATEPHRRQTNKPLAKQ